MNNKHAIVYCLPICHIDGNIGRLLEFIVEEDCYFRGSNDPFSRTSCFLPNAATCLLCVVITID